MVINNGEKHLIGGCGKHQRKCEEADESGGGNETAAAKTGEESRKREEKRNQWRHETAAAKAWREINDYGGFIWRSKRHQRASVARQRKHGESETSKAQ